MTQIIVITTEGDGNIGVTAAGGVTPDQAIAYLKAAQAYYEQQRFEAAVQAELQRQKEAEKDETVGET